jgi:hypothetical protein
VIRIARDLHATVVAEIVPLRTTAIAFFTAERQRTLVATIATVLGVVRRRHALTATSRLTRQTARIINRATWNRRMGAVRRFTVECIGRVSRARYYKLTPSGRQRLRRESETWLRYTKSVSAILALRSA